MSAISRTHGHTYLLRVCRALMMYGAPTHRLETYMSRTAEVLQLHVQSFYLPGCMVVSLDDANVQIVRCSQALHLAKLEEVHDVYKQVIHRGITAQEATAQLDAIMDAKDPFPRWLRVLSYGLASAFIGPVSYGARPIDLPLIFVLGSLVGTLELTLAATSELYGYVFEMSSAIIVSFIARALGSVQWGGGNSFCFSALAQASLVLILPGFTITTSALELQSRNIVSGSVRLVYGIIYTLFLAFGFTVGITIYGAIDSTAVSSTTCPKAFGFWWQILWVVPFTFCYVLVNQPKWKSVPAMLLVTLAGWVVNHFSAVRFPTVPSLPNALGALTVGVLANLYSRVGHGLAITVMHPAIFIQVPGSLGASGSLINAVKSANSLTRGMGNSTASSSTSYLAEAGRSSALHAGYAMVDIAIGITAGLSVSALLIYPFRKVHGKGGLFTL